LLQCRRRLCSSLQIFVSIAQPSLELGLLANGSREYELPIGLAHPSAPSCGFIKYLRRRLEAWPDLRHLACRNVVTAL